MQATNYELVKTEMNSSKTTTKETSSITTCGICEQFMTDPVTLPCLDSFCLSCLQSREELLTCPTCKAELSLPPDTKLDSLPYSRFIKKVVDLERLANRKMNDKLCDVCRLRMSAVDTLPEAVNYCLECHQKFCSSCTFSHNIISST